MRARRPLFGLDVCSPASQALKLEELEESPVGQSASGARHPFGPGPKQCVSAASEEVHQKSEANQDIKHCLRKSPARRPRFGLDVCSPASQALKLEELEESP